MYAEYLVPILAYLYSLVLPFYVHAIISYFLLSFLITINGVAAAGMPGPCPMFNLSTESTASPVTYAIGAPQRNSACLTLKKNKRIFKVIHRYEIYLKITR